MMTDRVGRGRVKTEVEAGGMCLKPRARQARVQHRRLRERQEQTPRYSLQRVLPASRFWPPELPENTLLWFEAAREIDTLSEKLLARVRRPRATLEGGAPPLHGPALPSGPTFSEDPNTGIPANSSHTEPHFSLWH